MAVEYNRSELQQFADYYAEQYNIPPALFSGLITVESSWNPKAKAKPTIDNPYASAEGLTQIIKSTQRELGITDIKDPEQQLAGGALYLSKMYNRFKNWRDALAAYNQGPGGNLSKGYDYADKILKIAGLNNNQTNKKLVIIDPTADTSRTAQDIISDAKGNVNDAKDNLNYFSKLFTVEFLGNAATIILGIGLIGGAIIMASFELKSEVHDG